MSAAVIHQALHGYRRGHELLAGSVRLPPAAADLVTRLSDLSGSMASGWDFKAYHTGYRLPGAPYFALARTSEDKNAPRAGCVLSHTLLVPIDVWKSVKDPRVFATLLAEPEELRNEERFTKPLQFDTRRLIPARSVSIHRGAAIDFVRKYFGEGNRPLIWIDCPDPEEVVWAIVRVLWPALREQFAWCTASLQPRSLDSRLLDLQFVPSAAYPRFHKIARENFIAGESDQLAAPTEPWCLPCADWIFGGLQPGPIEEEIRAFGPGLREDPTLMRNLFLARDLSARIDVSPMAGAGLLDVAEVLAPKPDEAVEYKTAAARKAVDAAMNAPPAEALKCLFLVGERLTNTAFQSIPAELGDELSAGVERLSSGHIRESLVMPERIVSRVDVTMMPYFRGVTRGLARCAKESPRDLTCLQEFNKTSPHLIAAAPAIAGGYLRGLHLAGERQSGREALAGWIAGLAAPELRHSLREEVLPEVREDYDAGLVEQLCRDLSGDDVDAALTAIVTGTDGFSSEQVLATLQEVVAGHHPDAVRAWAVSRKKWPSGVVSLLAATFPVDSTGFAQAAAFDAGSARRRGDLLTAYLGACISSRVPGWLKESARQSADWLVLMLGEGEELSQATANVLDRLLPELRDIPIATRSDVRPIVSSLSRFPFWVPLTDLALRSAVSQFVEGALRESVCCDWFSEAWAAKWVSQVSRGDLSSVLIYPVNDLGGRERAFRWLAFSPESLYQRDAALVPGMFWELVSERRYGWTNAMGNAWAACIRRVQNATPGSTALRMCADVLKFGFDHTGDVVGAAVAAAFYPVYRAVCDSSRTPKEVSDLFGWFDWDKAKELRKGLVGAFIGSCWSPSDLALSANEDEQLLRKLVKRMLRYDHGEQYLNSILTDLVNRAGPNTARTTEMVRELASNPGYYEPWD